jgi:uncharacterized protein YdcH (DUF465 family)
MVSETPRTDAAHIGMGIVFREFAQELERELNAANERINLLEAANSDVARIAAERDRSHERIKQLESAIKRASNRFFADGSDGKVAAEMLTIMCGIADEEP